MGLAALNGNGTLLVSWFTKRSTLPWPRTRREIPSGMASNRKPLSPNTSPTVRSGVTVTPLLMAVSIEGCAVLNPPLPAAIAVVPEMAVAIASAAQANAIRRLMSSSLEIGDEPVLADSRLRGQPTADVGVRIRQARLRARRGMSPRSLSADSPGGYREPCART